MTKTKPSITNGLIPLSTLKKESKIDSALSKVADVKAFLENLKAEAQMEKKESGVSTISRTEADTIIFDQWYKFTFDVKPLEPKASYRHPKRSCCCCCS